MNQPAVILIVRHGARLDIADRDWHLSSPTPYDPPLTYGGWTQSRTTGKRIAGLLRGEEDNASAKRSSIAGQSYRRRKFKVHIHSSPYLRCVQTAVAIGAGIAECREKTLHERFCSDLRNSAPIIESKSLYVHTAPPSSEPYISSATSSDYAERDLRCLDRRRTTLRIDSFLGEWLSTDYFTPSMAPPASSVLVSRAYATLIQHCDTIQAFTPTIGTSSGDLWGSASSSPQMHNPGRLAATMPRVASQVADMRQSSENTSHHAAYGRHVSNPFAQDAFGGMDAYRSPVPSYAIAPSEHIPKGYVAHARDACFDLDTNWNSREWPLDWGDGGEYGEEWSVMHKRFQSGFERMLDFYLRLPDLVQQPHMENDERHDEFTDLALVIVTHGAGCNALTRALTDQPVLLDFGMASLTAAFARDSGSPANNVVGLSTSYEMKMIASTDHLRFTKRPSRAPSPTLIDSPAVSDDASPTGSMSDLHVWQTRAKHVSGTSGHWPRPMRPAGIATSMAPRSTSMSSLPVPTGLWTPRATSQTYATGSSPMNVAMRDSTNATGNTASPESVQPSAHSLPFSISERNTQSLSIQTKLSGTPGQAPLYARDR